MKNVAIIAIVALAAVTAAGAPVPAAGSAAPAFSLRSQDGSVVSLDQFKGKWVVLYFYPKDFTSGCTIEARNFQRDIEKYAQKNAVVAGVSLDTVESHSDFCTKEGLNFRLLSDRDGKVTEKYGSRMSILGKSFAARNTFLIDPSGMVRKAYLKVDPQKHSEEVLADLGAMQGK